MNKWKTIGIGMLILGILLGEQVLLHTYAQTPKQEKLQEIQAKKEARTGGQKKLSSDLLQILDEAEVPKGRSMEQVKQQMVNLDQLVITNNIPKNSDKNSPVIEDTSYVYIELNEGYSRENIEDYLWEVVNYNEEFNMITAYVELSRLETLASQSSVKRIQSVLPPIVNTGSVNSEGDAIHNSDDIRSGFSATGSGVKIGVISDGVNSRASAQSTGDIPNDDLGLTILRDALNGEEGTAMLEIIHDLAPSAELYFHDYGGDKSGFNNAIDTLVTNGVNIIVDDITWLTEPFFEDGIIATHISDVLNTNDIIYVSSAGNSGQSHYQGTFFNDGNDCHDFSEGSNSYITLQIPSTTDSSITHVIIILQWTDDYSNPVQDYDLILTDTSNDSVIATGTNNSNFFFEFITYTNESGTTITAQIDVCNINATGNEIIEVFIYPQNGSGVFQTNISAVDAIYGHKAVPEVLAIGAVDASDPGNDDIQLFSSQGPSTIIGEAARNKPDFVGIDGVSVTGAGGFPSPFFGTSAAAPHIAAIAAQLWSYHPELTADHLKTLLANSATDLGTAGFDTVFGNGLVDALAAAQSIPTVITSIQDGDGAIDNSEASSGIDIDVNTTNIQDGQTVTCSLSSSGGGSFTDITGNINSNTLTLATGDLTSLENGTLTVSCSVADTNGIPALKTDDTSTFNKTEPTATDENVSVSYSTDNGIVNVAGIDDKLLITWDNSGTGDNIPDVSSVSADLSAFEGSATQILFDNATNGDETASDNIHSVLFTITTGTTDAENLNISITVSDGVNETTLADTSNISIDNIAPTLTAATLTADESGCTVTCFVGDQILITWDNSVSGDNNSDTVTITVDLSNYGGPADQQLYDDGSNGDDTASDNVFSFLYTVIADDDDGTFSFDATVTDDGGNSLGPITSTDDAPINNLAPTITQANISIDVSNCSGTTSICIIGDSITITWNNSASGDNNADVTSAQVDLSNAGGITNQALFDDGTNGDETAGDNIYSYTFTILEDDDDGDLSLSIRATNSIGNISKPVASVTFLIDNQRPILTATNLSADESNCSGAGGVCIVADIITISWDNSASGDNNPDEANVIADLSQYGGTTTEALFDDGTNGDETADDNIYTLDFKVIADDDNGDNPFSVSITDDAGNVPSTNPIVSTDTAPVNNIGPTVTAENLIADESSCTGSDGTCIIDNIIRFSWDNSASGDNNGDISTVIADLSTFGGPTDQELFDNATNGDISAADNIYSFAYLVGEDNDTGDNSFSITVNNSIGNPTGPITSTDTAPVDNIRPSISSWSLNLDNSTMTISVNETVDISTINIPSLFIQDAVTATSSLPIANGSTQSTNSISIVINLSATDVTNIKNNSSLGTSTSNTFLRTSNFIKDLNGNYHSPLMDGSALAASSVTNTPESTNTSTTTTNTGGGGGGGGGGSITTSTSTTTSTTTNTSTTNTIKSSYTDAMVIDDAAITTNTTTSNLQATVSEDRNVTILDSESDAIVIIPPYTLLTAENNWDGIINGPKNVSIEQTIAEGGATIIGSDKPLLRENIISIIKVGSDDASLNFSNRVNIQIPVDNPDGTKVIVYYSKTGSSWKNTGILLVREGRIDIRTNHFSYFAIEEGTEINLAQTDQITQTSFTDIEGHWGAEYIQLLANQGIVNGKTPTIFAPDDPITRAELTKIALNAFNIDVPESVTIKPFRDVETDQWYAPYLEAARKENIVSGYGDDFRPNNPVNRAEGLKILLEAARFNIPQDIVVSFVDTDQEAWYMKYVNFAAVKSIVSGYGDGRFGPTNNITRAEVSKIVIKILELK